MSSAQQLSFKGKVAIVTGSGNGLGRQYALDLARRGCKVVVNDLGGTTRGEGKDTSAADRVVGEIRAAGGEAVANYDSVVEGGKIVQTAIDTWGRVDIVINNAGILRDVSFAKMSEPDWKLLQDVHLNGAYAVTKAAWPHMRKQGFGRVLMVTSAAGLFGNHGQSAYAAVKMGLVGFANTLALEGAKQNILTNVIAPIAGSRMTETVLPADLIAALKPEYVSPLVLYLTHESCAQNGSIFEVGAGWVSRVRYERSAGVFFPLQRFAVEDVAARIGDIGDFTRANTYPTSPRDALGLIMSNLESAPVAAAATPASAKSASAKGGKTNPNVNLAQALAFKMSPLEHDYNERDVMLYALGIGAAADPLDQSELKFVYENHENFQVFPTFGVVIPSAALSGILSVPGLTFNPMQLLHGEQYMELKKPLPTSAKLRSFPRIANLYDKGSGALMILEVSTQTLSGEEVLFNRFNLFIRGLGGFGGDKGPASEANDPPAGIPPDVVHREKTQDNQALVYRLSGDMNPLHADPAMAKTGGFPAPILHGLCSFGYAARAVIKHFANNDGTRFKSIKVRFVSPVFPGETLVTEMWRQSPTRIVFRVRVAERGVYVLSNAAIELHPLPGAAVAAAPASAAVAAAPKATGFKAEAVFAQLASASTPELVKNVNAVFRFDVTKDAAKQSWLLDLKNGAGSVALADAATKADCVIAISDDDSVQLIAGKLDAQKAFMGGKIKLKGNMMLAQKLQLLPKPSAAPAAATKPAAAAPAAVAAGSSGFQAEAVFAALAKQASAELVKKVNAVFRFNVTKGDATKSWLLDLKNGSGSVQDATDAQKADCTITISDADFVSLMAGKLNAQQAFMGGKIKLKGNMMLAQKLTLLQPPKAKL